MHDFGAIVWVIIVVAGVISSMAKSAKKAQLQRDTQVRPQAAPVDVQTPSQRYLAQRALLMQQQAAVQAQPAATWAATAVPVTPPTPPPVIRVTDAPPVVQRKPVPKAAPKPVPAQRPTIEPWHQEPAGPTGYRGFLFEEKRAIVRGIIAAEVLGAPLSLREGSFWSQQHSGRSI